MIRSFLPIWFILIFTLFIIKVFLIMRTILINRSVVKILSDTCQECTDRSVDKLIKKLDDINLIKHGRQKTFAFCRSSWKLINSEKNISMEKKKELRKAFLRNGVNL